MKKHLSILKNGAQGDAAGALISSFSSRRSYNTPPYTSSHSHLLQSPLLSKRSRGTTVPPFPSSSPLLSSHSLQSHRSCASPPPLFGNSILSSGLGSYVNGPSNYIYIRQPFVRYVGVSGDGIEKVPNPSEDETNRGQIYREKNDNGLYCPEVYPSIIDPNKMWDKKNFPPTEDTEDKEMLERELRRERERKEGGKKMARSELYGFEIYYERGPADQYAEDGTTVGRENYNYFPWSTIHRDAPPQKYISQGGQKFLTGVEVKNPSECHWMAHRNKKWTQGDVNITLHPRERGRIFTNYDLIMKSDYVFFWTPAFIIFSITVPAFCMSYMLDEITYTTITVKVIGRQWYWVFEVESPVDEEDDEDEENEDED